MPDKIEIVDIKIVDKTTGGQFVTSLFDSQETVTAAALLFGGDRWQYVDHVAVAKQDEQLMGLASLAPCDELGEGAPQIIGIWVSRSYRRRGYGVAMLKALSEESQRRYGQVPSIYPVTEAGARLCLAAKQESVLLDVRIMLTLPLDL